MQYGTVEFDEGIDAAESEAEALLDGPVLQIFDADVAIRPVTVDRVDEDGEIVERVYFTADE